MRHDDPRDAVGLGPLFDEPVAPVVQYTSAKAFHELTDSGSLGEMQRKTLDYLKAHPGRTGREVDAYFLAVLHPDDIQRGHFHKRLPELKARGLLENGPARNCSVTGKTAKTWRPKS